MKGLYKNTPEGMRQCSNPECQKWFPATDEYFHRTTIRMKGGQKWKGLRPDCKECRNKKLREARKKK